MTRPIRYGRLRAPSFVRLVLLAVLVVAVLAVSGCGGSSSTPQTTLAHYLDDWGRGDWAAMRSEVLNPPSYFTSVNSQAFGALGISHASFGAGPVAMARSSDSASAQVSERFTLPHVGAWTSMTTVRMVKHGKDWLVSWSPTTINPSLRAGEKLAVRTIWPARAPILGAGGKPLTKRHPVVVVGVVGRRIRKLSAVRGDLLKAGAARTQVSQALAQAAAHPTLFEPVFTVSLGRFDQLKSQPGPENVYSVRGTEFERSSAPGAITPQLASHVVGSLGPVTAQQLKTLGTPYEAASIVGQGGLQGSEERTLAGVPSAHIDIESASGAPVKLLARFGGRPGAAVRTSLDPRVQRAAEEALAQSTRPNVSMVAIRASTGQVLAVVSNPLSTYDTALQGAYPPGSTFKVLTFSALHGHGLTPCIAGQLSVHRDGRRQALPQRAGG